MSTLGMLGQLGGGGADRGGDRPRATPRPRQVRDEVPAGAVGGVAGIKAKIEQDKREAAQARPSTLSGPQVVRRNNGPVPSGGRSARPGTVGRSLAEIGMTIALVVLLFVFWELQWSNVQSQRAQSEASDNLRDRWSTFAPADHDPLMESARAATGEFDAFAYMRIPEFGRDWSRAVMTNVSQEALAAGPGHYEGSQAPGKLGNAAFAGHRDGHGAPFHDADKLGTCDAIVLETSDKWLVYRVLPSDGQTGDDYVAAAEDCMDWDVASRLSDSMYRDLDGNRIIAPNQVDVVAPVPGKPELPAEEAELSLLTLTTCHPLWSNAQRMIVHAALADTYAKGDHPPEWIPAEALGT